MTAHSSLHIIQIVISSIVLTLLLLVSTPYYSADEAQASEWRWVKNSRYQIIPGQTSPFSPPSTLILQTSAPGPSEALLSVTSRVNTAYAKRWGFDYVNVIGHDNEAQLLEILLGKGNVNANLNTIQGAQQAESISTSSTLSNTNTPTDISLANGSNSVSSSSSTTQPAYTYDTVLFLDAGAVVVQLDYDIRKLFGYDNHGILMAWGASQDYSSVWSDVKVFNLKHDLIHELTDAWAQEMMGDPGNNNNYNNNNSNSNLNGDSAQLETSTLSLLQALKTNMGSLRNAIANNSNNSNPNLPNSSTNNNINPILSIDRTLIDGLKGTYIKEEPVANVQEMDLPRILPVVQGVADNVCYRYYPQCEVI